MSDKSHILVIDDEKNYLLVLQTLLEDEGYTVTAISDPETALAFLAESEVDVVVTDMKMPKVSGREVLQHVKKSWPYIPVLIMTAFGSIESAVEAMRYGAFNYITKPFSNDELLLSIQNAAELARAHRQYQLLRESLEERYGKHQIIGRSRAIRDMLALVDRAGPSRATVLITGESGTGKELVARAIHAASGRRDKPFIGINCGAIPDALLESELFGYTGGAFTGASAKGRIGKFELAHKGVLFLDEISTMPLYLQVKLLRVLQERAFTRLGSNRLIEVDIRIIAATNEDLAGAVRQGRFREDLFYRLNVIPLQVPPLRDRHGDIELLSSHFLARYSARFNKPVPSLGPDMLAALSAYPWPGNVREFENVMEFMVNMAPSGGVLHPDMLPASVRGALPSSAPSPSAPLPPGGIIPLRDLERNAILDAVRRCGDDTPGKKAAAAALGIGVATLYRKLKEYEDEAAALSRTT